MGAMTHGSWSLLAIFLTACARSAPHVETTADRFNRGACSGATALSLEVQSELIRLSSPDLDSCERHRLADEPAPLFVRTKNTLAHDDAGNPSPACTWEIFRTDGIVTHLGTLSACELRIEDACIYSLDENPPRRIACLADGQLVRVAAGPRRSQRTG
jgi:hypothetical protein